MLISLPVLSAAGARQASQASGPVIRDADYGLSSYGLGYRWAAYRLAFRRSSKHIGIDSI